MNIKFEGEPRSKNAPVFDLNVTISGKGLQNEIYRTSVGEGGETIAQVLDYVFGRVAGQVKEKPGVGNVPGSVVAENTTPATPAAGVVKA